MNRELIKVCALVCCAAVLTASSLPAAQEKDAGVMSVSEKAVIEELSLARTKPQDYAKFIEDYRKHVKADGTVLSEGKNIQTQEGIKAVDEAIAYLKKAKPLAALTGSDPLALAAKDHAADTGPKGVTGHDGTDKSTFSDRIARYGAVKKTCGENIAYGPVSARSIVMQLIIDDGVANRGHRTNIYNSDFKTVGVSIGVHKVYGEMCVMDFADAVTPKKGASAKKAQDTKAKGKE